MSKIRAKLFLKNKDSMAEIGFLRSIYKKAFKLAILYNEFYPCSNSIIMQILRGLNNDLKQNLRSF